MDSLNATELTNVGSVLQRPAEEYVNDVNVEYQWAVKAYHHAETYFKLVCAVDPAFLKLTKKDDEIYQKFRESFPDLKVDSVTDSQLKSPEGKEKWREFCMLFEEQVEDYNMGSLLRSDCYGDISEDNTILVPRIQFLAIEIARNREGLNAGLRQKFKPEKS